MVLHRTNGWEPSPLAADRWRPNAHYRTVRGQCGVVNGAEPEGHNREGRNRERRNRERR